MYRTVEPSPLDHTGYKSENTSTKKTINEEEISKGNGANTMLATQSLHMSVGEKCRQQKGEKEKAQVRSCHCEPVKTNSKVQGSPADTSSAVSHKQDPGHAQDTITSTAFRIKTIKAIHKNQKYSQRCPNQQGTAFPAENVQWLKTTKSNKKNKDTSLTIKKKERITKEHINGNVLVENHIQMRMDMRQYDSQPTSCAVMHNRFTIKS